jgi:hypothetical protein
VKPRLLADENTSHRLVAACLRIEPRFPIVHISDWEEGAYLPTKDPALLPTLRDHGMILVGFDRASLPLHAGIPTREGVGHTGVILFRRSVGATAYGRQARLLLEFWPDANVEPTRLYGFDSKTNGAYCRAGTASRTITCRLADLHTTHLDARGRLEAAAHRRDVAERDVGDLLTGEPAVGAHADEHLAALAVQKRAKRLAHAPQLGGRALELNRLGLALCDERLEGGQGRHGRCGSCTGRKSPKP